ncbi:LapA family protein [Dictyoglomus thermophilum]|uniref:PglF n=2 Tax=Dictyoglomus thermophilum TaxID=14 RepID=B5YD65_DICT6|nr:LapA family protein [Dictyoglomus thermophilum]ACI19313.1 PglF [Dictyoglomus thermophilum H-6-12]MCX7720328.1 LapA family protein [Dictyoglomus thermophilum]TYT23216.1 LapA family protein [Dictyoglomus thermophilum]
MSTVIIVLLVGIILALLFSFQNQSLVTIYFLNWSFEEKISTVLFLTFAAGVILAFISTLPTIIKDKRTISKLNKRIKELEKNISLNKETLPEQDNRVNNK